MKLTSILIFIPLGESMQNLLENYQILIPRKINYYLRLFRVFVGSWLNSKTRTYCKLARQQFLKMACQLEKKNMLGAYSLLEVIESEVQPYLSATKGRVGRCLALIQAASDVQEQGVDDQDHFLHGVRDLLSIHSNAQVGLSTYVSAPGIVQQISSLHSDLMTLQSDLENSLPEDRNRSVNELIILYQLYPQFSYAGCFFLGFIIILLCAQPCWIITGTGVIQISIL
nr:AUGMIN subunit 3-like isoform X2 [Malus domestica]